MCSCTQYGGEGVGGVWDTLVGASTTASVRDEHRQAKPWVTRPTPSAIVCQPAIKNFFEDSTVRELLALCTSADCPEACASHPPTCLSPQTQTKHERRGRKLNAYPNTQSVLCAVLSPPRPMVPPVLSLHRRRAERSVVVPALLSPTGVGV